MRSNVIKANRMTGFTLVELIIVIVILGILAAVAIPKLTSTSTSAYNGVQDATLSALKSAWSAAYAVKKGYPLPSEIAAQMQDPACTAVDTTGVITCTGVTRNDGTGQAEFTAAPASGGGTVQSTTSITITQR